MSMSYEVNFLKNNQSPHTHIQTKKNFFFFLNILKIFQNTIEVYGKKFKVKCTKLKLIQVESICIG